MKSIDSHWVHEISKPSKLVKRAKPQQNYKIKLQNHLRRNNGGEPRKTEQNYKEITETVQDDQH